jgi:prepilin-type processing-associated H-X9-DG protein
MLVVMGIIAILVACLLPAYLSAREACRRVACVNNLKQIHLAIHGYLTSYDVLPSGSTDVTGPVSSTPDGQASSWLVALLPYMEQTALYRAFDPEFGANHPVNHTVGMAHITIMACPSERRTGAVFPFGAPAPRPGDGGKSSYAGCHHDVEAPIDVDNQGVFYLNSRVRVVDVSDGLSQTLFVGEVPISSSLGWVAGNRSTLRNTGHPINRLNHQAVEQASPGPPIPFGTSTLEFERQVASGERRIAPTFVGGFGSQHVGGANFVFGDGSVRFLKQTIDQSVYQRLGHRADGEAIDEEAY